MQSQFFVRTDLVGHNRGVQLGQQIPYHLGFYCVGSQCLDLGPVDLDGSQPLPFAPENLVYTPTDRTSAQVLRTIGVLDP